MLEYEKPQNKNTVLFFLQRNFDLGLEHSQIKDSIMYPFYGGYKSNFKLHKEDITKIQGLYGDSGKILFFLVNLFFNTTVQISFISPYITSSRDFIVASPSLWRRGNWIFELNKIQGELKFFKIKREEKEEGRGIFEIFIGGKIAGDETSNRKQNFRMNLKMFSWVI